MKPRTASALLLSLALLSVLASWLPDPALGDAGGWILQDFHLAPWESEQSAYQGAALLMLEAGTMSRVFATTPENKAHLDQLQQYLRRRYARQPLLNRLYVLWAAPRVAGLLAPADQSALLQAIRSWQQADGGWKLASLEPRDRLDKTPPPRGSDGLATALVVLALKAQPGSANDAS